MMAAPALSTAAWRLDALLAGFAAPGVAVPAVPVARVGLDSRAIGADGLFLACQGGRAHGLDFAIDRTRHGLGAIAAEPTERWSTAAMEALARQLGLPVIPVERLGARAGAIAARFYHDPSAALEVIGITGTNGKTSVSHFVAQSLATVAPCAVVGTLGQGFPGALAATGMTTPDAIRLQAMLAELRRQGADAVAMEISSHALAQQRADAVRVDHAVLTNLSRDHLDYHGSMDAYAAAKARLFAFPSLRWAVLNADDTFSGQLLAALAPDTRLALYSLSAAPRLPASVQGRCDLLLCTQHLERHRRGLRLRVRARRPATGGELLEGVIQVDLLGRFNAANLLATLALLLARGVDFETALDRLCQVKGVPGRMECFGAAGEPLCVVDYAHTPDALEQALAEVRAHCQGQLILVFGCGGERDRGKRALMGQVAARLADHCIVTDDNPRHEDGDAIVAEILAGMDEPRAEGAAARAAATDASLASSPAASPSRLASRVQVERQRALAIRRALLLAGPGDAVLVAGKGHESEQDMGELKVRFSDRAQVMQALREWRGRS